MCLVSKRDDTNIWLGEIKDGVAREERLNLTILDIHNLTKLLVVILMQKRHRVDQKKNTWGQLIL